MSQEDFNWLDDLWKAKHRELYEALQRKTVAMNEVIWLELELAELSGRLDIATRGQA